MIGYERCTGHAGVAGCISSLSEEWVIRCSLHLSLAVAAMCAACGGILKTSQSVMSKHVLVLLNKM